MSSRFRHGGRHSALLRHTTTIMLSAILALTLSGPAIGAGPPSGGEEEAGNNLSYPVIWAEGSQLTLTGDPTAPHLVTPVDFGGVSVYLQGTENTWQAGSMTAPADTAGGLTDVGVSTFDWGDNLEAKSWPLGQNTQLRVEAVLYRTLAADTAFPPMDAFEMVDIDANPDDQVETWGTTGTVSPSPEATIYTQCARLTIQRLLVDRTDPYAADITWDAAANRWTGDGLVNPVPALMTSMGAEINKPGKVIFGHNWKMAGLTDGHYRITFYLDPVCAGQNTFITAETTVAVSEEEVVPAVSVRAEPDSGGGIVALDATNNLSYIDVQLGTPDYDPYVPPVPPVIPPVVTPVTPPAVTPLTPPAVTPAAVRTQAQLTLHSRVLSRARSARTGRLLARQRVRFYGSVRPNHDGATVRIQKVTYKRVDGKIRTYRTTVARTRLTRTTATRSGYDISLPSVAGGSYRAYLEGDAEHLPSASQTFQVRVR